MAETPPPVTPPVPGTAKTNTPGGPPPLKAAGAAPAPGKPGEAKPALPAEEEHFPQPTFWQQPWVQNLLPFVTSLTLHAAIIIVVVVVAVSVNKIADSSP